MNKKSVGRLIVFAILFGIIIMSFMFRLVFVKEVGDQFLIDTITEIGINIANKTGNNQSVQTLIAAKTIYDNEVNLPYDLLFVSVLISALIFTFFSAFKARKVGTFSFYGILFLGSFLMLAMIGFIEQLTSWFFLNFYNVLFADLTLKTPIMDWFFENLTLIAYFWAIIILLINRFDLQKTIARGRIEE